MLCCGCCRMVSYNIGHLAYLNAKRYGLSRVLFGGFFIRGHPYTMETISFAIKFWSKASHCSFQHCSLLRSLARYTLSHLYDSVVCILLLHSNYSDQPALLHLKAVR